MRAYVSKKCLYIVYKVFGSVRTRSWRLLGVNHSHARNKSRVFVQFFVHFGSKTAEKQIFDHYNDISHATGHIIFARACPGRVISGSFWLLGAI